MNDALLAAFFVATIASAIPLLLAALGETIGEQSGVLNVGLEGLLLVGAYVGFAVTHATGNFWFGFLCGALAGAAFSIVMIVFSVVLGVNQIVVGIGLTLLGTGVSSMLYDWSFADSRPRLGRPDTWTIFPLSELPVVGSTLFNQHGMFTLTIVLTVCTSLWLTRTVPGLRLRAAGQGPASLDAAGGNVMRTRSLAVLFGGTMAGLGGAYLALISAGTFTPGMTHGLGFLAIVVAMLGRGKMLWVALLSLGYGLFVAAGTALQLSTVKLPGDVVTIAPFVVVMIVLTVFGRRSALPPALAVPYVRGSR